MTTTKAAHTAGPWTVDGEGIKAIVRGGDWTIVAVRHRLGSETHEANCRLISAAPDMAKEGNALLLALEKILPSEVAIVHASVEWRAVFQHAQTFRAAIAKATGAA